MAESIACRINGASESVNAGTTVSQLLALKKIDAERVVVEVNLDIVSRETFDARILRDGDAVEILHFVGGG